MRGRKVTKNRQDDEEKEKKVKGIKEKSIKNEYIGEEGKSKVEEKKTDLKLEDRNYR